MCPQRNRVCPHARSQRRFGDGLHLLDRHPRLQRFLCADEYDTRQQYCMEYPPIRTALSAQCANGDCSVCPVIFELQEYGEKAIACDHRCHDGQNEFQCPHCGLFIEDRGAGAFDKLYAGVLHCLNCGKQSTIG